jgi:signal transduction histidine kinase/streptogramin lyase
VTQDGDDGYLLLSLATGLWHLHIGADGPEFRRILPSRIDEWRRVHALFVDREGTRWVGTDADGLVRLRPRIITVLTSADGLAGDQATSVLIDHRGRVWIGSNCRGFAMLDGARTHRFGPADGFRGECVWSFAEDRDGSIWVGTYGGGIFRVRDGRVERPAVARLVSNGIVFTLFVDRDGALWVGTGGGGITRIEHGHATVYDMARGLPGNDVRVIVQDRDGAVWAGTDGGLARIAPDGRITAWTKADGLAGNAVRAIYQDAAGTLWIGTYGGGLSRFANGIFTTITTAQGLFENVVSAILEDGDGYFWMSGNRGISRVRRADLDALAEGRRRTVDAIAYGRPDGLDPPETNGGFQPAGWKGPDGRLWFPTIKGLAVVDPRDVVSNPEAPSVLLEQVMVDGVRIMPVSGEVRIPASSRNVELSYTALSSPAPERIHFRYRLDGIDDEWVPAGTRRVAYYTRLRPGRSRFVVTAANRDGVWNAAGASLRMVVLPPFWMTWWFRLLATVAVAGSIALIVYRAAERKRRRFAAQQEFSRKLIEGQELERKRIAAELHDSIGQDLLVMKNRAQMGLRAAGNGDAARAQLERISEIVSGTLAEARQIAHNLRPYQLDRLGLTAAIRSALEQVADASGIHFIVELDDVDDVLAPEAEINVFRIVQEAANNIMKHSMASEARVSIRRLDGTLKIDIEDDGRGLPLSRGVHHHLAEGIGLGLRSIGERLEMLGGEHEIRSAPGAGTRLLATIPIAPLGATGRA